MNTVIGTVFDSSRFTWDKNLRILTSDISETPEVLRQLWNDQLDLGFGIRSHRTGKVAFFTRVDMVKTYESEVTKWIFEAHIRSIEDNQGLRDVRVHVFNT